MTDNHHALMSRKGISAVMTTLIILVASVVLGTGVVIYATSLFKQSPTQPTSQTPFVNHDVIKQSNGLIINKTFAIELIQNMVLKRIEIGTINQTDFWLGGFGNNEFPTFYINNLVLSDNTNQIPIDSAFPNDKVPAKIKIPNYLIQSMNDTVKKMMFEWNKKPFIKNFEDGDIPRITNTTVMTVSGYVVLDDSGNKVITLGTGNVILTDHVFTFGDYVTINKVIHDQMCKITYVTLSNGTEISGDLAIQVYDNPEKFGLMSKADATAKWRDWSNTAYYAHSNGCDKHEFVTWELVHKN